MVVLAASITTRNGKPLLSRQFRELTKDRVMELLSNFQGLVSSISSDHTFVEDEHVRYVYKPFDDYYIILITNRQSNIIQDLSTLNLFSQTVNSYLSSYDETELYDNAFEILSSFDEIVVMGYKENLTAAQVSTYLSMESHEERIQEIIERNKELEATEERKRRAKEIARREHERKAGIYPSEVNVPLTNKFAGSSDPNVTNAYNSYYSNASAAAQQSYLHSQQPQEAPQSMYGPSGTGMKLSAKNSIMNDAQRRPMTTRPSMVTRLPQAPAMVGGEKDEEEQRTNNGILITINETINAEITRDGNISSSELKGVLELRINDASLAHSQLALLDSINVKDKAFQFKTHPNIDKNKFLSSKLISLRDAKKSFPSNDHSLGVLRWRKVCSADDTSLIPLNVSAWVTPSDNGEGIFDVTLELEITEEYGQELENVSFVLPVVTENVKINDESNDFNARIAGMDEEVGITIKLDSSITPGSSGVVAFTVEAGLEDAMFPITVGFKHVDESGKSLTGVGIANVTTMAGEEQEEGEELPYEAVAVLKTEEYLVV
ncbi:hypothetical protein NCAS_0F04010 [Naumovozyma castellii]|uniref:Coatomer subunit delta n=1 Tax=Naumovozyma castellii TaxID=27288 RepID=G0VHB2_NAUCA|nr:hypothetical protein NCAS_0F04010 [Naumovozyma castellii CBS 4309]CCC70885.1 hypothetical protein NCAS_0F04010 [Naumovozyma castellii CBS 4309]